MNNRNQYITIGVIIAIVVGLFYLMLNNKQEVNWYTETIQYNDTMPYGGELFYKEIKGFHAKNKFIKKGEYLYNKLDTNAQGRNYIFMGQNAYQLDSEINVLAKFVANGNNAIYITNHIPSKVFDIFDLDLNKITKKYNAWHENYRFEHPSINKAKFKRAYRRKFDTIYHNYMCIGNSTKAFSFLERNNYTLDDFKEKSTSLAHTESIDTATYFFKINYGKGAFYFHFNPILLSNYSLTRLDGMEYSRNVLAHFNSDFAYFDHGSNFYKYGAQSTKKAFTPLSYILSQKPLKFSFYTLLGIALIWLLFFTKRKQKIIPVLAKNKNTSLDYVKTIGALYYSDMSYNKLIKKELDMLFAYTKWKYRFDIVNHTPAELVRFIKQTRIDTAEVNQLINYYKSTIHLQNMDVELLIQIQQKIHKIYTLNYDRK